MTARAIETTLRTLPRSMQAHSTLAHFLRNLDFRSTAVPCPKMSANAAPVLYMVRTLRRSSPSCTSVAAMKDQFTAALKVANL